MAGLVHEGATIKLPGASPFGAVVVFLRTGPENIHRYSVDSAETPFLGGTLEQLQRGITAVLFDNEEADVGVVAGFDHSYAVVPAGGHGLFGYHVAARLCRLHSLFGVQTAGSGQDHYIGGCSLQQLGEAAVTFGLCAGKGLLQGRVIQVADIYEFHAVAVLFNSGKVIGGYPPTAHQRQTDFTVSNLRVVVHGAIFERL